MSFFNRIASVILTPIRAAMILFSRIIPGLKKLPGISVPARFGFLVFFCLIIYLVSSTLHVVVFDETATDQLWLKNIWTILLTILLLFLIPFLVYLALDQLMRREVPPFPDIQKAWKAGIKAMNEAGIDLKSTPIFFVIGSDDVSASTALHQCGKTNLSLKNVPPGNAPIQWFGNNSAMFVHLAGASCVSKLASSPRSSATSSNSDYGDSPGGFTGTIVGGMPAAPQPAAAGDEGTGTGTITGDSPLANHPDSTGGHPGPTAAFQPTKTIGADQSPMIAGRENNTGDRLEINQSDLELQIKRLRYVCSLTKKNRQPICPLNGIVTLIPFSAVESSHDQLQVALQADLETIEDVCQLKCPNTILVGEIEREPGFSELMRRLERDDVQNGRIGSRYGNADTDIWTPITGDRIKAMAGNACKNIEDNILGFFRRDDALTKRGNGQLFILLSKLRGGYTTEFINMWVAALGRVNNLMVGCYFVAIGDSEDRQGFVSSVIQEKVIPNRGKLSWNQSALAENNRYVVLSSLFALLAVASIVWLAWMIGSDQGWWAALNPNPDPDGS